MLKNGLAELIGQELEHNRGRRFVDLFCGSAAVAWHVAEKYEIQVVAADLQLYSVALAQSVLARTKQLDASKIWMEWHGRAATLVEEAEPPTFTKISIRTVSQARQWCSWFPEGTLIQAYGGHYFSPEQATWIEALRRTLPSNVNERSLCLAALIIGASRVAASPGHTAQPFQPTETAKEFLEISWKRNLPQVVFQAMEAVAGRKAKKLGLSFQGDANDIALKVQERDVVFVDPPYSGVHYSRFYHVLESIAVGEAVTVSGVGRYPPPENRPRSEYSTKSGSLVAVDDLLNKLSRSNSNVIFTFPDHLCSNGLSGQMILDVAENYFRIKKILVDSTFSTLGGAAKHLAGTRKARQQASELILSLQPK